MRLVAVQCRERFNLKSLRGCGGRAALLLPVTSESVVQLKCQCHWQWELSLPVSNS